jgi:hypothetical protein
MGITGIIKPLFVIPCAHCGDVKAFFLENPDGSKPVDLMWENFPRKGRFVCTTETMFVACWACREGLDTIISEHGKLFV